MIKAEPSSLSERNKQFQSLLHIAVLEDNSDMVQALLSLGIFPDDIDKKGQTPLLAAIENSSSAECIEKLLINKADPNKKDREGFTPLMRACEAGEYDTVKVLLAHHASITEKTAQDGRTCLHYAVGGGNQEIVKLILDQKNGSSLLDLGDSKKRTPLFYSEKFPEIVALLKSRGADTEKKDIDGKKYNELSDVEEEIEGGEEGDGGDEGDNEQQQQKQKQQNKKKTSSKGLDDTQNINVNKGQNEDEFVPKDVPEWLTFHQLSKYTVPFKRSKLQLHQLHTLTSKDLSSMGIDQEGRNKILKLVSAIDPSEFSAPSHMRAILTVLVVILAIIPFLARFFQE